MKIYVDLLRQKLLKKLLCTDPISLQTRRKEEKVKQVEKDGNHLYNIVIVIE